MLNHQLIPPHYVFGKHGSKHFFFFWPHKRGCFAFTKKICTNWQKRSKNSRDHIKLYRLKWKFSYKLTTFLRKKKHVHINFIHFCSLSNLTHNIFPQKISLFKYWFTHTHTYAHTEWESISAMIEYANCKAYLSTKQ